MLINVYNKNMFTKKVKKIERRCDNTKDEYINTE